MLNAAYTALQNNFFLPTHDISLQLYSFTTFITLLEEWILSGAQNATNIAQTFALDPRLASNCCSVWVCCGVNPC